MGHHRQSHRRSPAVEADLLARLHTRDRDAFDLIYRRYAATLGRYIAARLHHGPDDVDDLVQDAFCDALTDPTGHLDTDVLGCLLRLAARARTRSAWSRRRYLRAAYTVYATPSAPSTDTSTLAAGSTTSPGVLPQAMAMLTAAQRRALQLRYVDGYPADATARLMSTTTVALASLERRALQRLQHILRQAPAATGA